MINIGRACTLSYMGYWWEKNDGNGKWALWTRMFYCLASSGAAFLRLLSKDLNKLSGQSLIGDAALLNLIWGMVVYERCWDLIAALIEVSLILLVNSWLGTLWVLKTVNRSRRFNHPPWLSQDEKCKFNSFFNFSKAMLQFWPGRDFTPALQHDTWWHVTKCLLSNANNMTVIRLLLIIVQGGSWPKKY